VFGDVKDHADHAILLEDFDGPGSDGKVTQEAGLDEAVALKVNAVDGDVEDEPVSEGEGEEDTPETSTDS
jgi:hypothetical protein